MSSSSNIGEHHKTRVENCKGIMHDPIGKYVKWAYWCPNKKYWFASKCDCYDNKK